LAVIEVGLMVRFIRRGPYAAHEDLIDTLSAPERGGAIPAPAPAE
jgi:hypothetical protein